MRNAAELTRTKAGDLAEAFRVAREIAFPRRKVPLSQVFYAAGRIAKELEDLAEQNGRSEAWVATNPAIRLVAYGIGLRHVVAPVGHEEAHEVLDEAHAFEAALPEGLGQ